MIQRNPKELESELRNRIAVTRQQVTMAKAFLQRLEGIGPYRPAQLAEDFAREQGFTMPSMVVVNPTVDSEPAIRQAEGSITSKLAMVEAVYALVHNGYFLSAPQAEHISFRVTVLQGDPRGSNNQFGWTFDEFDTHIPSRISLAPSFRSEKPQPLTDPDLFLLEAGITGADPEVEEALRDAVRCFRHELFQPAVSMLGKAVEGAWIELGLAVSSFINGPGARHKKFEEEITGVHSSFQNTIEKVSKLCEDHHKTTLKLALSNAGTSIAETREIAGWSHVVREGRNAIHFGNRPVIGNSYEKVAALLLGAAGNLGTMYRLKTAAENNPAPEAT